MSNKKYDRYIGIDPSFVTMGAAKYNPETNALQLFTGEFDEVIDWISTNADGTPADLTTTIAVVENPALNQNTFGAVKQIEDAIVRWWRAKPHRKADLWKTLKSIIGSMLKISRDAGENMGAAKYLIRKFERVGIPVIQVAPSERDKAVKIDRKVVDGKTKSKTQRLPVRGLTMPTKTSQAQFAEITGHVGRTTEHARDAATMIYGRSITWGMMKYKMQTARANRDK